MYRKGTIILPILIVLVVISLAAAGILFYLYQNEHTQNAQLKEQISELEKRQSLTEGKLSESKKTAAELQLKLQETKAQVDSLTEELTQEKSAHTETSNKLEQSSKDLEQQKTLRQDLEDRLKTAQDEGKKINEQLKIIQQQKTELENKIKDMESGSSGVELGKVVVSAEAAADTKAKAGKEKAAPKVTSIKVSKKEPAPAKSLEGKIMIINKEFNFAVINVGSKDDVKLGDEFSVLSDSGNPIADLKVEKVHESMSAAGFSLEAKDVIKENYRIVKKVK